MRQSNIVQMDRIFIGQAARLYGLTHRAIRFYEDRGFLRPQRDRRNNRFFDGAELHKLEWISLLRNAGVPLDDVADVLAAEARDGTGRACALEKLRRRRRVAEIELALVDIATLKLQLPNGAKISAGTAR